MTAPRLFHAWLSSASRRVRLCLAEKGIAYEGVAVDLGRQEQHSPAFLAMNPNGVVPALELAPGRFLHESATICEYLDDWRPEPPLRPADPYARALMRNFVRWTDERVLPALLRLNWSQMLQPTASRWSDDELAERLRRIPTAERREAWARIARRPYTDEELAEARGTLAGLLDRVDSMLADGDWLIGGAYSLADVAATPFVARAVEILPDALRGGPGTPPRPRAAAWWDAVRARPSYAAARLQPFAEVPPREPGPTGAGAGNGLG